jgi:hypothetical protein
MSEQVSKVLRIGGGIATFWCPGCDEPHRIRVEGPHAWGYNGKPDAPTFTPSVLVTSGHYVPGHSGTCWCEYRKRGDVPDVGFSCSRCHSFVTDGRIHFLPDCTHALVGQTVPLAEWPADFPVVEGL